MAACRLFDVSSTFLKANDWTTVKTQFFMVLGKEEDYRTNSAVERVLDVMTSESDVVQWDWFAVRDTGHGMQWGKSFPAFCL